MFKQLKHKLQDNSGCRLAPLPDDVFAGIVRPDIPWVLQLMKNAMSASCVNLRLDGGTLAR